MQRNIIRGAAANSGIIFHVFAQDSASSTGAGKASVAFGSWSCRYIRNGEAISGAITPQDITTIGTNEAPTANTNIRIKAVDNTNMIGVYEVHVHLDWVNTTNTCQSLTIYLTASGVAVLPIQIPLIGMNVQDGVRGGMTALPNAAANAAGGLPISTAGGLDMDAILSRIGAPANLGSGATLAFNLVDVENQTDDIGVAGAGLTALGDTRIANLDAAVSSRMATYTQPVGFLAAVFPSDPADHSLIVAATDAIMARLGLPAGVSMSADIDALPTAAEIWSSGTRTLTALGFVLAAADIGTDAIGAAEFSQAAADKVWSSTTRLLTAGTNIVLAKGVGVTGFNDVAVADLLAQAQAALVGFNLDHLMGADAPVGVLTAGSVLADLLRDDGGVWSYTANALELAPGGGGGGIAMGDTVPDPGTANTVGKALRLVLTNVDAKISTVGGIGAGAVSTTVILKDTTGALIPDAEVWISNDLAGLTVIAGTLTTDGSGQVTFMLDPGTYYRWAQKAGYNFTNPQLFTVT